jgi:hypothetical protein
MPHYRLYSLKNGNQIARPPQIVQFPSDQEAIAQGKKDLGGLSRVKGMLSQQGRDVR